MSRHVYPSTPPGCSAPEVLLASLQRDVENMPLGRSESIYLSYPEFLRYFEQLQDISAHNLVIGASFVYSWMPTMLDFRSTFLEDGAAVLSRAKQGASVSDADLLLLASIVNNSIVGASKLLHCVAPSRFAIWDSRVADYLNSKSEVNGRRGVERYRAYNDCLLGLAGRPEAQRIARKLGQRLGIALAPFRALELTMYHAGLAGYTFEGKKG